MSCPVVADLVRNVSASLEEALGLRGPFDRQVRRARRSLPRALRREADLLAHGWHRAHHPKLARSIDRARLRLAHDRLIAYLGRANAGARRRALIQDWVQTITVNLLAAALVLAGVAAWHSLI